MFRFPWGDMHSLNLGWFLQKFNELREDWATAEAGIDGALDAEIQKAEDALSDVFDARDAAAASATAAAGSATAAAGSATAAQNSATGAASSATLANQKATAAGLSEAAAAQSATQAGNSATAAGTSATQAGNSATNAAASETAAGQSAAAAAASAASIEGDADAAAASAAAAAQSAALIQESAEQITENEAHIAEIREETYNKIEFVFPSRSILGDGTQFDNSATDLWFSHVQEGKTYAITAEAAPGVSIVAGFFTTLPTRSSVTYDNSRVLLPRNAAIITAPISGYIGFTTVHDSQAQIAESASMLNYVPPVTGADYIARAMIAKTLPTMTATRALQINDLVIVNQLLYKITAPIAEGGTLTPGTNCTVTTLAEILKPLM